MANKLERITSAAAFTHDLQEPARRCLGRSQVARKQPLFLVYVSFQDPRRFESSLWLCLLTGLVTATLRSLGLTQPVLSLQSSALLSILARLTCISGVKTWGVIDCL